MIIYIKEFKRNQYHYDSDGLVDLIKFFFSDYNDGARNITQSLVNAF